MNRIICPFEVKIDQDGDEDGTINGYGSTFGNVDSYGDTVAKGAFNKTITEAKSGVGQWPAMLLQHGGITSEDETPIGIWTGMDEDDNGLKLKGKIAVNTTRGADAYNLLKMKPRPALNGLSIGYIAKDFQLHKSGSGPNGARRTLKGVDLHEVSLVTFPADKYSRIGGVKTELNTIREFETFLRDVGGFSIAQAKAISASGYKAIAELRDEAGDVDEEAAAIQQKFEQLAKFIRNL
jgi:HK97 family phage prohead protease